MDVRMPDGTIIRNVPEGTTKAELESKLQRASLKQMNPGEYDPNSEEFKAKYGATSGMSGLDKFMAGAGKSVVDMGRGLKQLGLETVDLFRSPQLQDLVVGSPADQYRSKMDEVRARDADLMSTGAGLAGNITGMVASTLIPAATIGKVGQLANAPKLTSAANAFVNPQTLKGAAAAGAAIGATQPVATDESRLVNTAFGGLAGGAGQAVVKGIGRIAQPIKNALSPVDDKAVQTLENAGVALDAAQKTGSQRALQVKRFLGDNPVTASGQTKQAEKTASTFTQAALREIGESADVADEVVLNKAYTRIGQAFDDVATRNPIRADNQLLQDVTDIAQKSAAELEGPQAAVIAGQIDEVINKASATGSIDGKAYQNIKTTLDRISNGQNQQIGFWARELRAKLDDALQRSASAADVGKLKNARKEYRNFLAIEKALNPDGNVSPSKLYNAFNVKAFGGKRAMATGKGANDLMRLAKAGKRIIPERMPNSGTTPRALLQAALPLAGGAYGFMGEDGNLADAAKFAALGVGSPLAAQRLLNNPALAQYLTRGLRGPARTALLQGPNTLPGVGLRQAPVAGLFALQAQE